MMLTGGIDAAVAGIDRLLAPVGEGQALRRDADSFDDPDIGRDPRRPTERETPAQRRSGQHAPDRDHAVRDRLELGGGFAVEQLLRRSLGAVTTGEAGGQQSQDDRRTSQPVQPHLPTPP
jgi:hypothetical protein